MSASAPATNVATSSHEASPTYASTAPAADPSAMKAQEKDQAKFEKVSTQPPAVDQLAHPPTHLPQRVGGTWFLRLATLASHS